MDAIKSGIDSSSLISKILLACSTLCSIRFLGNCFYEGYITPSEGVHREYGRHYSFEMPLKMVRASDKADDYNSRRRNCNKWASKYC